jgi:exosome complex RNA-binding protein Rrp42 (RNase PH superfamily)
MLRSWLVVLMISSACMVMPTMSYAQTQSNMIVFVQVKVHDSSGNLISYMESTRITLANVATLNQLLDQSTPEMTKSIMESGNKKFEVIKINDTIVQPSATVVSKNMISATNGKSSEILVLADHDGYPVVQGDVTTAYWTIIRPVS